MCEDLVKMHFYIDNMNRLMHTVYMKFNKELAKREIAKAGRTRTWVAKECRIAPSTLNAYLSDNDAEPSAAVVKLMSLVLNIDEVKLWLKKSNS